MINTKKEQQIASELAPGVSVAGNYAGIAAINEDNKVILIKRGGAPAKGIWSLPAGYVEDGETPEAAAIREIKEETGLEVSIDKAIGKYLGGGFQLFIYTGRIIGGDLLASGDADDAKFFELNKIPLDQSKDTDVPLNQNWAIKMNSQILKDIIEYYENSCKVTNTR